ncbi:unnamed protein product [Caenorhabditis auriculariae]|uniref:RING-type domain-containing protein n=1 Tax=Caenorhabditis auriculariae TaxID=2777116 RepID=A0A8S1HX76_9PELO|nr:unnamed protein product [Caenorhabditis auriculariae]
MAADSSRFVSFLVDGGDVVGCEVCLEPFDASTRAPKLLPCGHNFCESCLFSICCHQEYYLLDSINCPTCRAQFPTKVAKTAPTNYDLCKVLEKQRTREANVTVIYLPDKSHAVQPSSSSGVPIKSKRVDPLTSHCKSLAEKSTDLKHLRCADCHRKMSQKQLSRVARYCIPCTSSSRLTLACLECCVNAHNGHQLLTFAQLEANQLKVLSELRALRKKVVDCSDSFDRRSAQLQDSGRRVCSVLLSDKQNLLASTLSSLDDVIRKIEATSVMFPLALSAIHNKQVHNFSRLSKLSSVLEKTLESPVDEQHKPSSSGSSGLSRSLSSRHSRVSLRGDDTLWQESVAAICMLLTPSVLVQRLHHVFRSVSPRDTIDERSNKISSCTTTMTQMLEGEVTLSMIPIFADAFLNGFYQLHELSRKTCAKLRRDLIWKQVQLAYSELLRIAAKNFPAYHPERVDILDDLAYLCRLFADVCDEATVTICVIEAARARASESGQLSEQDQRRTDARLKLIDDHLMECRRMRNLQILRTTKTKKDRGFKKLFIGCFAQQRVHA